MKIWRFYLKPDKNTTEKEYKLYALTNKKKLAKEFIDTRNMDRFIVKKSEEEPSVYIELATANRSNVLEKKSLITKDKGINGFVEATRVDVVCTEYEYQSCEEETVESYLFQEDDLIYSLDHGILPVDCFNSRLQDALRIFQYPLMCNLYNDMNENYDAPDFKIDELSALISEFRDTF